MPNKLDEISRVICNIEAEVRGLSASVAEVRHSTAEHHRDSRERLETINARVEKIEADMRHQHKGAVEHRQRMHIPLPGAIRSIERRTPANYVRYCSPTELALKARAGPLLRRSVRCLCFLVLLFFDLARERCRRSLCLVFSNPCADSPIDLVQRNCDRMNELTDFLLGRKPNESAP